MDMAQQSGPGRFPPDAARQDRQEWVEDKIERSARDWQVSPDVSWVNSFTTVLPSAQLTGETTMK